MLATSLLLTALQSTPIVDTKPLNINVESVLSSPQTYDEAVLEPLREAQAAKAEKDRLTAIEAAKQAEIARQKHLKEIADRVMPYGTYANNYTPFNCTRFVASRIRVPNSMGNAKFWVYGLRRAGWTLSSQPVVGAIGISQAGYAGHVVLITSVRGAVVGVSEMNYAGYGVISSRYASISEFTYAY